ncbi:MAG: hypothetical protein ACPGXI_17555 [Mycobacterium sp.]
MLDLKQRNTIRGYLDKGMSPDAVANYFARLADLEESDMLIIRSAAYDILNESNSVSAPAVGPPGLRLIATSSAALP